MLKKFFLTLTIIGIHLCNAQVKWTNTKLFEQKNFIENKGQFDLIQLPNKELVLFVTKIDGVIWYFTKNGYTIERTESAKKEDNGIVKATKSNGKEEEEGEQNKIVRIQKYSEVTFENANAAPEVISENKVNNYYSYSDLKSKDKKGTLIANAYKRITYKNIYPKTDIVFEFPEDSTGLEYSICLRPGADVAAIKIKFPDCKKLNLVNNNIEVTSDFGIITNHKPISFLQGNKQVVKSNFSVKGNKISFELGNYDHSKTLIIDPWTVTPAFGAMNDAYDVDYDNLGNVYAYGGTGPYELVKYTAAGTLVWTYTAAMFSTIYYGDFAVDRNSNNIYLIEGIDVSGSGSHVVKINSSATQLALFGGNPSFNEMWRIAFSRCTNEAVIAGGGVSNPTFQTCFLDSNLVNLSPVTYVPTTNCCHDVGLLALDNYGNAYEETNQRYTNDGIYDNTMVKLPLPALSPTTYAISTNYAFRELSSAAYYNTGFPFSNGYNGITTSSTFVFTYDGYVLKKWDGPTGALLIYDRISWPPANDSSLMSWGGISADDCGNLFLGDNTNVRQYDANLNLINSYPMPGAITDVNIANSGILYVCGLGFLATVQPTNIVNCQNSGVLSLTTTSVPASCTTPGSATAVVTGGNPPYNLVWNTVPPQTGLTITGVPAGTYTATIIDGGCLQNILVDSVVVGSIGGVTASSSSTIATCGNNNGTATVTPLTGQPPYTYLWTGGGQTTQTAVGLAVGTYTCTITDNMGCTTTQVVSIISNGNITSTYTATPTGCTTSTGTATVTGAGGQAPYTYLWSNGQTTQTGTGFPVGTFSCVVTDALGCSQLQYVYIISNNPLTLSISSTPTGCTTSIGTATAITGNGALPYTYNWSNSQTGITATGLGLGNITCTVTDNNGCTITQSTNIISNNPIGGTFTQTLTGCTVNNGTATVTPSNGALPYTYSWTGGQTTQTATGLGIGTYTCTITDANGCTHSQAVTIVSNNPVTLSLTSTITGCTVNNGTATANANNGALPYTYSWTGGQTTATATGLGVGSYTCTATDANGCAQTQSVNVLAPNNVTLSLTMTQTNCTANNGAATATAANGTLPFTYLWSNGQTTPTATGLAAGTYTCVATDALGCAHTTTIIVTSNNPLTVGITSTQTICTAFTGTATATPANGTLPYNYFWIPGGQTTQTANSLSTGGYFCTVTDANGCSASNSITVTQTSPPVAVVSPVISNVISGQSVFLTASGGTTYVWTPTEGLSNPASATIMATPPNTTTYCVLVTDGATGCTDSTCIEIIVKCNAGLLDVLVPTAFSPNSDGMNDELCIPINVCIIDFELDIFDRWGEKVFTTSSVEKCWDGSYKGANLSTAGFVYTFTARLSDGQDFKQKGTISLIK